MTSEGNDGKVWGSTDALSLHAGPNSNAYSPREALARMEAGDAAIRAFLPEAQRRTRVEAACAAAPAGPLYGVLVGVKDVIRVTGLDTRAGSALPPETRPIDVSVADRRSTRLALAHPGLHACFMPTTITASGAVLFAQARAARAQVLELWPEGEDLETLPEEQQMKLAAAQDVVVAVDKLLVDAGFAWHR